MVETIKPDGSNDIGFPPSSFELPLHPEEKPTGRVKNVVLDWYGTIYNCVPLMPAVFADEMYRRFGVSREFGERNFKLNEGLSIPLQIEDLLGSERYDRFDQTVIEAAENALYNALDNFEADIFEDVPGGLFKLIRKGYNLSVLSHNKEASLRRQVEKKGLTGFFKFVVGRDSCEECKDKGEGFVYLSELHGVSYGQFIGETVFVTDTTVDARRSASLGVSVIARNSYSPPQNAFAGRAPIRAGWDLQRSSLYRARADWVISDFWNLDAIVPTL